MIRPDECNDLEPKVSASNAAWIERVIDTILRRTYRKGGSARVTRDDLRNRGDLKWKDAAEWAIWRYSAEGWQVTQDSNPGGEWLVFKAHVSEEKETWDKDCG